MKSKIKSFLLILTGLVIVLVLAVPSCNAQVPSHFKDSNQPIEGVYEFVSQEINITKPTKEYTIVSPPEWKGIWIIKGKHYSSFLMKSERSNFFDCQERDLGHESYAGEYIINNDVITFSQNYSSNPLLEGINLRMKYKLKSNLLILTQTLQPKVEDIREGTVKTILRKIN